MPVRLSSSAGYARSMLARMALARRVAAAVLVGSTGLSGSSPVAADQPRSASCQLGSPAGTVQHIIYLQFDNVHFARDNPNVPSDLEQMPHLLSVLTGSGTLLTQQHTPLI